MKQFILLTIKGYQLLSRSLVLQSGLVFNVSGCRQWPTCSDYTQEAIIKFGIINGGFKAIKRLLRCNWFLIK